MSVQLRTGLQQRYVYPIPDVDQPGCEAGTVSTRRWLNWRQANAATVFGIEFMRAMADVLTDGGVTPTNSWIEQSWHKGAGSPNRHQSVMDPRGEDNCAALVNAITYPAAAVTLHQIITDVVPQVITSSSLDMTNAVGKPGQHVIAPYLWTVELATPTAPTTGKAHDDLRQIVVTSPHYYCGYATARVPSPFGTRHWPIDPDSQREPLIYDVDPAKTIPRADVPKAAVSVVDAVRTWGEYLGFRVQPVNSGEWRESTSATAKYTIHAPVEILVDSDELFRRAQPYWGRITVARGSREPSAPHIHRRLHLAQFNGYSGFRVWITDPDADGRFVLTVESPAYR
jgi:hypothetical protein